MVQQFFYFYEGDDWINQLNFIQEHERNESE